MKKILIVEDIPEKAERIKNAIRQEFSDIHIVERSSYHSALEEIFSNYADYCVILLDMTMSTYDVNVEENGGVPEAQGGKRILEGMYLRDIPTKVKVVTMFDSFEGKRIKELDRELKEENPDNYDGYIFFSFQKNDWIKPLTEYIKKIV